MNKDFILGLIAGFLMGATITFVVIMTASYHVSVVS